MDNHVLGLIILQDKQRGIGRHKDFRTPRSDIDDTVKILDDVAREIDAILSQKKGPAIKVP